MSNNYNKVKEYYDKSLWTIDMLKNAVIKTWITADEFKAITGQIYA